MCVLFWFGFGFLNNNIYNVASGSFVFSMCYRGRLGPGQVHTWPAEGTGVSQQACLPLCGWSPPSQVPLPQASVPTYPRQTAALPSFFSIPMAQVRLNSHLSPPLRKNSQAWCLKPLLREGRSGVYIQKRREVVHVQKGVGPCLPFQRLRRNWQGTENRQPRPL